MPPRPKQSIEVKINLQSIAGNAFSNPVGIYVCPFFVIVFVVKFLCGGPNTQPYTFYHVRGFVCLSLCVCVCVCVVECEYFIRQTQECHSTRIMIR